MYYRIRSGLGYEKCVAAYGAFPIDPYSHTPRDGGAKQPGMTGQVKEEILTRRGELGVGVAGGNLRFDPVLLEPDEFAGRSRKFDYFDVEGRARSIALPAGSLAFTVCQVPVVYERVAEEVAIRARLADCSETVWPGNELPAPLAAELFARTGRIDRITVRIPRAALERPWTRHDAGFSPTTLDDRS
jgi:hypothetical protein